MAEITAKLVKELRDKTGAGMGDCKKALEANNGDMETAVQWLRERGAVAAAKRADREAKEGAIAAAFNNEKTEALLLELNCETDFVARADDFLKLLNHTATLALAHKCNSLEDVLNLNLGASYDNITASKAVETLVGKIGEKIEFGRYAYIKSTDGVVVTYIHPGAKLASMASLSGASNEKTLQLCKDIAMQVAANAPISIDRTGVTEEMLEKEKEVFKQQALREGKPEKMMDKIIAGRIEKFYQDVVLLEQQFFKDNTKAISDLLKEASDSVGKVEVKSFVRFQLGDR
ncbi:MAG: translation elongation factor Ts [Chloroherpetonaceae bacterium]|nr:translation elongation factor Ts [Chloroherpetonaceae bacterium]